MKRFFYVLMAIAIVAVLAGCPWNRGDGVPAEPGTVTVRFEIPELAAMNAGSNAVDSQSENRALSNLLVLDADGVAEKVLEWDGQSVVFEGGETLTVYANVWNGPQTDGDYRFQATRKIMVNGDLVVVFDLADNEM